MKSEIPTRYDFAHAESQVLRRWLESDAFAASPDERANATSS